MKKRSEEEKKDIYGQTKRSIFMLKHGNVYFTHFNQITSLNITKIC